MQHKIEAKPERAVVIPAGKSPLDVLLFGMAYHLTEAQELQARPVEPELAAKHKVEVRAALAAAGDFAKDAAPYIHPRLTAVEATGAGGEPLIPADAASNRSIAMAILALLRGSVSADDEQSRSDTGAAGSERGDPATQH